MDESSIVLESNIIQPVDGFDIEESSQMLILPVVVNPFDNA